MPTSATGNSQTGFTLIELLVALALFGLAALALIRLQSGSAAGVTRLETRLIGQMVARNIAVAALARREPPPLGILQGTEHNGRRDWRWTRIVGVVGQPGIVRIDIAVTADDGLEAGRLTLYRPGG